jgi:hypothetical protein
VERKRKKMDQKRFLATYEDVRLEVEDQSSFASFALFAVKYSKE